MTDRPGDSFEARDVARHYTYRPPYAQGALDRLIDLAPSHRRLLDLGCGTGKIARALAPRFDAVTGIDASAAMLDVARAEEQGSEHITWVHGLAESAPLTNAPYDLVVAAASIHWMDQPRVFARLATAVSDEHVFAVVDGDGAHEPPWKVQWDALLGEWIPELTGQQYEPERADTPFNARMNRYRDFIAVAGEAAFDSAPVRQRVTDFVRCQHSRDTFAPQKLGDRMVEFDAQLEGLLRPYAADGYLEYVVRTWVTWGVLVR